MKRAILNHTNFKNDFGKAGRQNTSKETDGLKNTVNFFYLMVIEQ